MLQTNENDAYNVHYNTENDYQPSALTSFDENKIVILTNAKQFERILKRRVARTKLIAERKIGFGRQVRVFIK